MIPLLSGYFMLALGLTTGYLVGREYTTKLFLNRIKNQRNLINKLKREIVIKNSVTLFKDNNF